MQNAPAATVEDFGLITNYDLHCSTKATTPPVREFGSHLTEINGQQGTHFARGARCSAHFRGGGFTGSNLDVMLLHPKGGSRVWDGFVPGLGKGAIYK